MAFKKWTLAGALMIAGAHGAAALELTSPDLAPGATIDNKFVFKGFGCEGGNVAPALNWSGAPEGTKSFALLVHDPDAPTGGAGFWHWLAIDIPADVKALPQGGKLPEGAKEINTDFGAPGYGGPCPPKGDKPHHYNFTVYALKVPKLDLPPNATASLAGFMINANALAHATLTSVYGR
jgi:Raf kinase inhibitor-like YbhB/YbcL family protein